jgi:hypothetical protein
MTTGTDKLIAAARALDESIARRAETTERVDPYRAVNDRWPDVLPAITMEEAGRASRRLVKHFGEGQMHRARYTTRPGRRWATARPTSSTTKGWHRLVHDVSHAVWSALSPASSNHNRGHGELELEMVEYVLAKGWLDGRLRTAEKKPVSLDARRAKRTLHLAAQVARWTRRKKLATTKLRYWTNRQRAAARRQAGAAQEATP